MPYLVHSPEDRAAMLAAIGVGSMEPLLSDIPASLRIRRLELPDGLSEPEAMGRIRSLAGRNRVFEDRLTFRGGGVYRRFIPAAVPAVTSKGEFYTAYTPYQPEASQGWLQAIYEFQTMIAQLTAMDVANASLYDGATAVAEAAMMAVVHTGRDKVLVAGYLHPEYEETLRGFAKGRKFHVLHHRPKAGVLSAEELEAELHDGIAAVIFQQPNFLGLVEDAAALTAAAHAHGALAIASVDPISPPSSPRLASTAPTSPSARSNSSAWRRATAVPTSASWPAGPSLSAACPGAWSDRPSTARAGGDSS